MFYMNKKKAVPVLLNAYEPRIRQKMGRVFFDIWGVKQNVKNEKHKNVRTDMYKGDFKK